MIGKPIWLSQISFIYSSLLHFISCRSSLSYNLLEPLDILLLHSYFLLLIIWSSNLISLFQKILDQFQLKYIAWSWSSLKRRFVLFAPKNLYAFFLSWCNIFCSWDSLIYLIKLIITFQMTQFHRELEELISYCNRKRDMKLCDYRTKEFVNK